MVGETCNHLSKVQLALTSQMAVIQQVHVLRFLRLNVRVSSAVIASDKQWSSAPENQSESAGLFEASAWLQRIAGRRRERLWADLVADASNVG